MAQYIFLGIERLNFTNDREELIQGYNLHFATSINKQGSIGLKPFKSFKNDLEMSEFLANDAPFHDLASYSSVVGKPCTVTLGLKSKVENFAFKKE